LFRVLASLRPHVDRLHVYLNGYEAVPVAVEDLADEWVLGEDNAGAERKFWWAGRWDGVYLSCDDDIVYPPDYVPTMVDAAQHAGRALVTMHGRTYLDRPRTVHEVAPGSIGKFHRRVDYGRPVNCGGTGVMAWDCRHVTLPTEWEHRNMADLQVAAWAQRNEVPMWLVAHQAHYFEPLALVDPQGLFKTSQRQRHARRNALLVEQGRRAPWRLFLMPSMTSE